ncbi:hypothetical protein LUZ61_001509 [Rhynchospora tenuis]|uniref:Cystatin domain-containing protein n=1 Tax=Rhynchospora tenuis TaxID=198213 RepID=A0AAD5ZH40_9POAL|nr:hypothetical protein LUZ61_001509 [Rhynchospora tenuis]
MRMFLILLPLLLISLSFQFHVTTSQVAVGGWYPIKNITDSDVQELGSYAVSEHNRQSGDNLEFHQVVSGETQVVGGVNYRLVIEAGDAEGNEGLFQAVVYERAWEGYRELTSFKQV